jgi:hypothetical protein
MNRALARNFDVSLVHMKKLLWIKDGKPEEDLVLRFCNKWKARAEEIFAPLLKLKGIPQFEAVVTRCAPGGIPHLLIDHLEKCGNGGGHRR